MKSRRSKESSDWKLRQGAEDATMKWVLTKDGINNASQHSAVGRGSTRMVDISSGVSH